MDAGLQAQETLNNNDIPAAFWDTLADDGTNPDLLAINALQEESTPEERAETLKVHLCCDSSEALSPSLPYIRLISQLGSFVAFAMRCCCAAGAR